MTGAPADVASRSATTAARPARDRVGGVLQAVVLRSGEGEEDVAGSDLAAVERHAGDGARGQRLIRAAEIYNVADELPVSSPFQLTPCRSCRRRLHSPGGR